MAPLWCRMRTLPVAGNSPARKHDSLIESVWLPTVKLNTCGGTTAGRGGHGGARGQPHRTLMPISCERSGFRTPRLDAACSTCTRLAARTTLDRALPDGKTPYPPGC
jgi:hypothetical protein